MRMWANNIKVGLGSYSVAMRAGRLALRAVFEVISAVVDFHV
jgi:hypothetical protein